VPCPGRRNKVQSREQQTWFGPQPGLREGKKSFFKDLKGGMTLRKKDLPKKEKLGGHQMARDLWDLYVERSGKKREKEQNHKFPGKKDA